MDKLESRINRLNEAAKRLPQVFDRTKKQSDLVGMYTRLGAVIFLTVILFKFVFYFDDLVMRAVFFTAGCGTVSFGASFYVNIWRLQWWMNFRYQWSIWTRGRPSVPVPDDAAEISLDPRLQKFRFWFVFGLAHASTAAMMSIFLLVSTSLAFIAIEAIH